MSKVALITGVTGQDGSYLAEFLLDKGYEVVGLIRRTSTYEYPRLKNVINNPKFHIRYGDVTEGGVINDVINQYAPDEVYNLAAQSHVGISFENPEYTMNVSVQGITHLLTACLDNGFALYNASSSEMFGNNFSMEMSHTGVLVDSVNKYQDENTPFEPASPYASGKLLAHNMVKLYRESYGLRVCSGILFNHESPRRGSQFVTRKITKYIAKVYEATKYVDFNIDTFPKLQLGNITAQRDWGYAPDYVEAMWTMLQQDTLIFQDYVVCTGNTHTIKDFLVEAFKYIGIDDYTVFVEDNNPNFNRPNDVEFLKGRSDRIKNDLGWSHTVGFSEIVERMIESDIYEEKQMQPSQKEVSLSEKE